VKVLDVEDHRFILTETGSNGVERRKTVVEPTLDPVVWLRKHLEQADTDLLREMVRTFVQALMSAEADAICGAPYGERSEDRTNRRNGYRTGTWDTRTGTIDLAVPKLREGSYFPDRLLEPPPAGRACVRPGGLRVRRSRRLDPSVRGAGQNAWDRADCRSEGTSFGC
jgi:hypothetical protein